MRRVFLIDDEEIANYINEWTIKSLDVFDHIHVFQSARTALDTMLALQLNNDILPELILLDLHMPAMNGFEFLNELTSSFPDLGKTKVIMLTTSESQSDRIKAMSYHLVKGFLAKPLRAAELTASLSLRELPVAMH